MLKFLILKTIVLIAVLLPCVDSHAFMAPKHLTYERFVHMTPPEQEEIIILAMDYMVDAEKTYLYESSSTTKKDFLKKYYSFLKLQVENILIQNAHASDPDAKTAEKLKENFDFFQKILAGMGEGKPDMGKACFYAGWPSMTNAEGKCLHPKSYKDGTDLQKLIFENYSKTTGEGSCKDEEIACNPGIFGFKSAKQASVFCVSSSGAGGKSPSNECRKLSLKEPADGDKETDGKQVRLGVLKTALAANKDSINQVYLPIIQSCMCKEEDIPKNYHAGYLNNIRGKRTCYGLLDSIKEGISSCDLPAPFKDPGFSNFLRKYDGGEKLDDEQLDKAQEAIGLEEKSASYNAICKAKESAPVTKTAVAKNCKYEGCTFENSKLTCASIKDGDKKLNTDPVTTINCPEGKCVNYVSGDITCNPPEVKKVICRTNCTFGEKPDQKMCGMYIVHDTPDGKSTHLLKTILRQEISQPKLSVNFDGTDFTDNISHKVECDFPTITCNVNPSDCSPSGDKYACQYKVNLGEEQIASPYPQKLEGKPGDFAEISFSNKSFSTTVRWKCKIPEISTTYVCSVDACTAGPDNSTKCAVKITKNGKEVTQSPSLNISFGQNESSKKLSAKDGSTPIEVSCNKTSVQSSAILSSLPETSNPLIQAPQDAAPLITFGAEEKAPTPPGKGAIKPPVLQATVAASRATDTVSAAVPIVASPVRAPAALPTATVAVTKGPVDCNYQGCVFENDKLTCKSIAVKENSYSLSESSTTVDCPKGNCKEISFGEVTCNPPKLNIPTCKTIFCHKHVEREDQKICRYEIESNGKKTTGAAVAYESSFVPTEILKRGSFRGQPGVLVDNIEYKPICETKPITPISCKIKSCERNEGSTLENCDYTVTINGGKVISQSPIKIEKLDTSAPRAHACVDVKTDLLADQDVHVHCTP